MNIVTLVPTKKIALKSRCGLDDPNFKYVPAASTDIRVRFDFIRAQQAKQEKKVHK